MELTITILITLKLSQDLTYLLVAHQPIHTMEDLTLNGVFTVETAEDDYFKDNPPPKDLAQTAEVVKMFVQRHSMQGHRVVLITSGGTTVPLENQTVRFIDNFSAGTRGATSAEYFLENGYAVIFLHRRFSLLPYSRHYSHSTNCFLDFMEQDDQGKVTIKDDYQVQMQGVLERYQSAKKEHTLLLLPYTTISEYLWSLREIAFALQPLGVNAVFYLAAAVSDFFIPKNRMSEHKIQSGDPNSKGPQEGKKLIVDLDPVPKFLKRLVDGWAPGAMIVSFKLETDPSLLISKAKQALERYSHHLVIGNLLTTRAWEVVLVSPGREEWVRLPHTISAKGDRRGSAKDSSIEIESLIVPKVIKLHDTIIKQAYSS